jgi:hypothetical protein
LSQPVSVIQFYLKIWENWQLQRSGNAGCTLRLVLAIKYEVKKEVSQVAVGLIRTVQIYGEQHILNRENPEKPKQTLRHLQGGKHKKIRPYHTLNSVISEQMSCCIAMIQTERFSTIAQTKP